jgi:cysteine desulfuration protein SufE
MSIETIENEIIEEFSLFEDNVFDKFGHLIDLGKNLEQMDSSLKTDDRLIKGCQANVWLFSELKEGKVYFKADADADYAKGLVAMMIRVFTGQTPEDILNAPLHFIQKIGFDNMLSMKRSGGLASMIKQMKLDALAYKMKG